jgi:uncharacterized protein
MKLLLAPMTFVGTTIRHGAVKRENAIHRPACRSVGAAISSTSMDDEAVVRILREAIPDLVVIYRFGSTVRGDARASSDVDLAVFAAAPLEPVRRFELQERIAEFLGKDVDLVDLRTASTVMRLQVVSRGIAIDVARPQERRAFEGEVLSAYARLNEERREVIERVRREKSVHGG